MGKENETVSFPFHHFSTILRFNVPTTPWRKTLFIYAHRKDRIEYIAIENRTVTFRLVSFLFLLLCPRLPFSVMTDAYLILSLSLHLSLPLHVSLAIERDGSSRSMVRR